MTEEEKKAYRNALAIRAQQGDQAALVEILGPAMTGLIVRIASPILKWSQVERSDLHDEARALVLQCVYRFDPNRPNADFGGMCGYFLQQELPEYVRRTTGAVTRASGRKIRDVSRKLNRFISAAEARGLSTNQALREAARHFQIKETEATTILMSQHYSSVGAGDDQIDVQDQRPGGEDIAQTSSVGRALESLLGGLSEQEREIVERSVLRKQAQKVIAKEMGLKQWFVHRSLHDAIAKMRTEAEGRGLSMQDFL